MPKAERDDGPGNDELPMARQLVPTADQLRAAAEWRAKAPVPVALRVRFVFSVRGELTFAERDRDETLGFMIPGGVPEKQGQERLEAAVEAAGLTFSHFGAPKGVPPRKWSVMEISRRQLAVGAAEARSATGSLLDMPSEEAALRAIAEMARDLGERIARSAGILGGRRPDDVAGVQTAQQGLGAIYDELEALDEARQLRESIGAKTPSKGARPAL